ncbi:ABC1 kinase family protein [Microbacterium karelineae]|uniref:ABC1 kinase family protein n=1 Tax=Microbacterium karelineae TaxID=2654283 RepID=UPI0012EAE606|nr:AarF/UbiB family protein [Microbacterium karelineae]
MVYLFGSILASIVTLCLAVLVGAVIRRLLDGVPGPLRSSVTGLVVLIVLAETAVPIADAAGLGSVDPARPEQVLVWLLLSGLVLAGAIVGALAVLVVVETLVPSGALPGPVTLVRESRARVRRLLRYVRLAWIASTSGLLRAARQGPESPQFARAVVETLSRSGATFIKIGQVLSTRADQLPRALAGELARLQKDVEPVDGATVQELLAEQWDRPPGSALRSIESEPLAAASLAQVHAGVLHDGTEVVVKVRRPGAAEDVRVDCDILRRFAARAQRRWAWARAMDIDALADGLSASLLEEIDYRHEADNTRMLRSLADEHRLLEVPQVVDELSGDAVLVMTRLRGVALVEGIDGLSRGRRTELAQSLITWALSSVLVDGAFHADLHPGNIMLLDDQRIGVLDLGAIGVLGAERRQLLAVLLFALLNDDDVAATNALTMVFAVESDVDRSALQADLGRLMTLHARGGEMRDSLLSDITSFLRTYRIGVPGDVAGAFRTLMSLWATVRALDSDAEFASLLREAIPPVLERLTSSGRVAGALAAEAMVSAAVLRRLPARAESISRQLAAGEFVVRTRSFTESADRSWAAAMIDRFGSAVLAAVLLSLAVVLFVVPVDVPPVAGSIGLDIVLGAISAVAGAVLALRHLIRVFTR